MKEKHITQSVNYLRMEFKKTLQPHFKNITALRRGNKKQRELYDYQCDFAYMIDRITRGPIYDTINAITDVNNYIKKISKKLSTDDNKRIVQ